MMEINQNELSIRVDSALLQKLSTYSEALNLDQSDLVNDAMDEFFKLHQQALENLISGYVEMGTLNTEICKEFQACDAEAYEHIS